MKQYTYIGTKTVKAEPMELGVFVNQYRNPYGEEIEKHQEDEPGYLVEYDDGYKSWSPKEVFENAYHSSESFTDRMINERSELRHRIVKLENFIYEGKKFLELSEREKDLLKGQVVAMRSYCDILQQCLDIYTKNGLKAN